MNTQDTAQDHNTPAAEQGSGHAQEGNAERSRPNAQDPNNPPADGASPTAQDPTTLAQPPADPAPEGPVPPGRGTPVMARTGLASGSPQEVEAKAMEDPHEVRARLTRRGSLNGLELDAGTGVVFIPQHALPDLRRRLLLAQERFTAMSGPVPGKRRKRRPASAR